MIDLKEDIPVSPRMSELLDQIAGQASDILSMATTAAEVPTKDLFAVQQRKGWKAETLEARCDFTPRLRMSPHAGCQVVSLWQKSIYGQTLTEIKADDANIERFASSLVPVIQSVLGAHLQDGHWAICATPKRRHLTHNFAESIAEQIGLALRIPFYDNVATCATKQRINAIFTPQNIPAEPNIIVFDDFVTTGSTLVAMKRMLEPLGKNFVFFVGINNNL